MGKGVEIHGKAIRLNFTYNGKRHRLLLKPNGEPLSPTTANIKYANRVAAEIREKIKYGVLDLAEYFGEEASVDIRLSDWFDKWIGLLSLEGTSIASYKTGANFWSKAVGGKYLSDLRLTDLMQVLVDNRHLKGKTLNCYISVIKMALALAVEDGAIPENVAAKIPHHANQKSPPDPFSREEIDLILGKMKEQPEQVYNLTEFWMYTGLRTSEALGLKWANVGDEAVTIQETLYNDKTKTKVVRSVMLNSRSSAALARQERISEYVFLDPDSGSRWRKGDDFLKRFWMPCLYDTGVRYRRPYNMRHTYATIMLMAGLTPAFCAKQLGHSIRMFLTTYARWLDGDLNQREMDRLERSI